jgi:hypothetical protein
MPNTGGNKTSQIVQNAIVVPTSSGISAILYPTYLSPEYKAARNPGGENEPETINPQVVWQAHVGKTSQYPLQNYNGLTGPDSRGALSQAAQQLDHRPAQFRRFVDTGSQSVQLRNGLQSRTAAGTMFTPYPYGQSFVPSIPGQTRDNVAGGPPGFGPTGYTINNWMQSGPGSQPENPGGVGFLAGNALYNPMSG